MNPVADVSAYQGDTCRLWVDEHRMTASSAPVTARIHTLCYPVVGTNGRPSAATMRLLTGFASAGTTLHVRADDDIAGQDIVSGVSAAIQECTHGASCSAPGHSTL